MFEIFKPFEKVNKNSDVFICSWNVDDVAGMRRTVDYISRAKKVRLLVGFSKTTHDCNDLKNKILDYMEFGWTCKVLPSFHSKIWTINNDSWIGSCNFFPDSIHNYMHKTKITPRLSKFIKEFWSKGYNVTNSSKLWLLPQK